VISVLLIDGESMYTVPASYCLAAANRPVHVGSATRFPDLRFSRFHAKFHWWDDASSLLDQVRSYAARERVAVIMGCSDAGVRFVSENRRELEMVTSVAGTPSVLSLDTTIDKANFAGFLEGTNLPHPETIVLRAGQPHPRKLPGFPAILKPARGSGGERIQYFQHTDAFGHFVDNGGLGERVWILQSYITGRSAGCSALCRNGKILA
jgi:predicted ATP-grasp superfamily ATP-dependent carboligase